MSNASTNTVADASHPSASVGEAQASVIELATNVALILESNQDLSRRMARLEQQNFRVPPSTAPTITRRDATPAPSLAEPNTIDDTESIMTIRGPVTDAQTTRSSNQGQTFGYSFDQDLNASRPYTRATQKHRAWSTTSSEIHTMGWSCLSGVSLAEVSHISVINLPFCPQDLWNGQRYSEKGIDRDGFILSKYKKNSLMSLEAPTFRRRLGTMIPVHVGQKGRLLNTIKEDAAGPVAARTILLIGMFPLRITNNLALTPG